MKPPTARSRAYSSCCVGLWSKESCWKAFARMSSARESPQFAEMYLNGVPRTTLATDPSVSPARVTSRV